MNETEVGKGEWKNKFDNAITQDSISGMIDALQSQATAHAGTANSKVKSTAIKAIERHYKARSENLFRTVLELCLSGNPTAQEVGAHLLATCFEVDSQTVESVLHNLADSPNWEVREWVAAACGTVLEQHFDHFYPTLVSWATEESENVRRAVALAVMYAGKIRNPDFADPMLDVIEMLLPDRSTYVRDNLGPFAIGSGLIKYYPDHVLERLHRWAQSDDEQVRWNVAMVFSAADGAKYAPAAREVLGMLALDERSYVQKAVARAMKNIRKRCPEFFGE